LLAKSGSILISIQRDINPFSLIMEFINYRRKQGISQYTVTSFRSGLTNFFTEYRGSIRDSKKLRQHVLLFLGDKKASYHNKLLQALRQFFDYCIGESLLTENPTAGIKFKRGAIRIVEHDEKTIKALLNVINRTTFSGYRDYIIVLLFIDTGIRPNELLQLRIPDIDFVNNQINVREEYSKTRQLRVLPISEQVAQGIRRLIASRHSDWSNDTPVFCSFSGNRLSTHNLQEKFREYSALIGVNVTPYSLRHTFATWFIRNGGNVFALQKLLGHTKLDMSQVYVNLVQADIKRSHNECSPLLRLFAKENRVGRISTR